MRCEEAKRQMIEGADAKASLRELAEHVEKCDSCARFAEANRIMERLLKEAQGTVPVMPLSAVRDRVDMMSKQQSTWEKIMSHLKDQYHTRPRLMAGMGLAVAVFFFIVLVPFSVTYTVGWRVPLDDINAEATPPPEVLNAAFAAAGLDDIYVTTIPGDDSTEDIFVKTPSQDEAREIVRAIIAEKVDSAVRIRLEPVVQIKSQTLLAQVYDRVKLEEDPPVRIRFEDGRLLINGQGIFETLRSSEMTDAQVKQELSKILKMNDGDEDGVSVDVQTSDDGETRIIEIQASNASLSHALSNIELLAGDGSIGVKYKGDVDVPDSVAIVELSIPDKDDTLTAKGIKMQILIDLDEDQ